MNRSLDRVYTLEEEMAFIGERYLNYEIPKELAYLTKYARSEMQLVFLRYLLVFDTSWLFTERTGYYVNYKHMQRLRKKFRKLIRLHTEAKQNADLETLARIESGKYVVGSQK